MDMGVWCWCFGDAVSPVYLHCSTFLKTPGVMFPYECDIGYAGESSTNSTDECTLNLFLFADAMKRNIQRADDEYC